MDGKAPNYDKPVPLMLYAKLADLASGKVLQSLTITRADANR